MESTSANQAKKGRIGFFAGLCSKYGDEEVLEAWDTACAKYDNPMTALSKLGGVLHNRSLFSSFIEEK